MASRSEKSKLWILILITLTCQNCQGASSPNNTEIVNAMVEGGKALKVAIKDFVETSISPAVKHIENEINKIDLTLDGLTKDEKNLVLGARRTMSISITLLVWVRTTLEALATGTFEGARNLQGS